MFTHQIHQIDSYLSSAAAHPDSMDLAELDGFLTAIACNPAAIAAEEWMHYALGNATHTPYTVQIAVKERFAAILEALEYHGSYEPMSAEIFDDSSSLRAWCRGFVDAVELRPERWDALSATYNGQKLLTPILALVHSPQDVVACADCLSNHRDPVGRLAELIPALYRQFRVVTRN